MHMPHRGALSLCLAAPKHITTYCRRITSYARFHWRQVITFCGSSTGRSHSKSENGSHLFPWLHFSRPCSAGHDPPPCSTHCPRLSLAPTPSPPAAPLPPTPTPS